MVSSKIINGCLKREHWAFRQCYEECVPYVITIIKNYISNKSDQEDVVQEVFAQIFHSLKKFDHTKGKFKSWIGQITINQCINFLRKNKKLTFLVPINEELFEKEVEEDISEFDKINGVQLTKCIQQMPEGYRTIFLLNLIEGYSHEEIAQILEIKKQTSRSQLTRALKWLRNHLKKEEKKITYA